MSIQYLCDICQKPVAANVVVRTDTGMQIQFYPSWYPNINDPLHICFSCIKTILDHEKTTEIEQ